MGQRLELQAYFEFLMSSEPDVGGVYFQRPPEDKMEYPAIVYNVDDRDTLFADDRPYVVNKRYQVTVISRKPDIELTDKVANMPKCRFARHFVKDGLNHDIFALFF